jgi:hypothetical protein
VTFYLKKYFYSLFEPTWIIIWLVLASASGIAIFNYSLAKTSKSFINPEQLQLNPDSVAIYIWSFCIISHLIYFLIKFIFKQKYHSLVIINVYALILIYGLYSFYFLKPIM